MTRRWQKLNCRTERGPEPELGAGTGAGSRKPGAGSPEPGAGPTAKTTGSRSGSGAGAGAGRAGANQIVKRDRLPPKNTPQANRLLRSAWNIADVTSYNAAKYRRLSNILYIMQLVLGISIIVLTVSRASPRFLAFSRWRTLLPLARRVNYCCRCNTRASWSLLVRPASTRG